MKKKRNNKGFTLVEVLIAMAIISVVVLFLIIADSIVLDECASPCRSAIRRGESIVCPAVCDKVTLLDWILGNG